MKGIRHLVAVTLAHTCRIKMFTFAGLEGVFSLGLWGRGHLFLEHWAETVKCDGLPVIAGDTRHGGSQMLRQHWVLENLSPAWHWILCFFTEGTAKFKFLL